MAYPRGFATAASVDRRLEAMVAEGHRAGAVVRRLRVLAKKGNPQKELLEINKVIKEVLLMVERVLTGHSVTARTELTDTLLPVQGDRIQLQRRNGGRRQPAAPTVYSIGTEQERSTRRRGGRIPALASTLKTWIVFLMPLSLRIPKAWAWAHDAAIAHENAKSELKSLVPEDAKVAFGHGVRGPSARSPVR